MATTTKKLYEILSALACNGLRVNCYSLSDGLVGMSMDDIGIQTAFVSDEEENVLSWGSKWHSKNVPACNLPPDAITTEGAIKELFGNGFHMANPNIK
jgi:hypothetical protein